MIIVGIRSSIVAKEYHLATQVEYDADANLYLLQDAEGRNVAIFPREEVICVFSEERGEQE